MKNTTKSLIYLTITSICWALPPSLGKLMEGEISSEFIASFRLFFAALILFLISMLNGRNGESYKVFKSLSGKEWLILVIGGTLEGIHYVFYFEAVKHTTALSISILVNVGEIFVATSGFIFFKEKITKPFIAAIIMAIFGILFIVTDGNFSDLNAVFSGEHAFGDLLIITSAFLFSLYAVCKKYLIRRINAFPLVVITFFIGSMVILPFAIPGIIAAPGYSSKAWILLILITIFGSAVGYYFFALGLKYSDMSKAGIITLSSPIFAIFFSIMLVPGESSGLTFAYILGAFLIVISVFLVSYKGKRGALKETSGEEEEETIEATLIDEESPLA